MVGSRADNVTVSAGSIAKCRIASQLGAVQLSCDQSNAAYQLLTLDGWQVEAGMRNEKSVVAAGLEMPQT
jgi:hypothetical protein